MVLDLDSLVASLPAKQEQKRVQELEQRRQQVVAKFAGDTVISNTSDPRRLNSVGQCMYIIRCMEHGLGRSEIIDLFYGDQFTVDTIVNVIGVNNLLARK